MRMGARWAAGSPPHPGVPAALHPAIAAQEARHPGASSWTLTWLENRPRCALDELVVVGLLADGRVGVEVVGGGSAPVRLDGGDPGPGHLAGSALDVRFITESGGDEDDDDDWLS